MVYPRGRDLGAVYPITLPPKSQSRWAPKGSFVKCKERELLGAVPQLDCLCCSRHTGCLPAFQRELAGWPVGRNSDVCPHPLAWPECVHHLGSPQNAVGFELTSQDSIQEPRWWGKGASGVGRGHGAARGYTSGGHHPPQQPPQPLASTPNSSTQGYQQ